jgi:hypothetical protein
LPLRRRQALGPRPVTERRTATRHYGQRSDFLDGSLAHQLEPEAGGFTQVFTPAQCVPNVLGRLADVAGPQVTNGFGHCVRAPNLPLQAGAGRPNRPKGNGSVGQIALAVREIVRVNKSSHGGEPLKCRLVPCFRGFVAGAARGIRTPDPIITKDVSA